MTRGQRGSLLLHCTCSLPVCPAQHSRYGVHTRHVTVFRDGLITRGFNRFVTSTAALETSGWSISPGVTLTHWKAPHFHGAPEKPTLVVSRRRMEFTDNILSELLSHRAMTVTGRLIIGFDLDDHPAVERR
jgi:hypothetical protein